MWWWKLRLFVKRCLSDWVMEYCQDCGRTQPFVWRAPQALWHLVMRSAEGVVCPRCFERRAWRGRRSLVWTCCEWPPGSVAEAHEERRTEQKGETPNHET